MIDNSYSPFGWRKMILLSVFLYCLLFTATLNWYRFYFDTDGVAYMTLARRIADHDFLRSVNGLWSPLNNWIAAPFSSFTGDYLLIYKLVNAFASIGVIIMTYLNARRYIRSPFVIGLILLALPVILLSYTHVQLAGDLLQLFFFLIYFYLITAKGFFLSIRSNLLAALVMFLAYLAKSFSLPFFVIQYPGIYLLFAWLNRERLNFRTLAKPFVYGFVTFFVLASLWAYCLFIKYGKFMYSAAGTLNYNWMVGRESAAMPGSDLFIPPPYSDSPGFWEDPYTYYKAFIGPFSSFTYVVRTLKLVWTNTRSALACLLDISFLSYTVFFFLLLFLYLRKIKAHFLDVIILVWTSLIILGGYLLIHVETRYYWPVAIMLLVSGGYLLEYYLFPLIKHQVLKAVVAFLFVFTFVFSPIYTLKDLKDADKSLHAASLFLKTNHLQGKFAGNYTEAGLNSWYLKLAYLSGSNLYTLRRVSFTQEELLQAIRANKLDFFIYTYGTELEKQLFLKGDVAAAAGKVLQMPNENKLVLLFPTAK